MRRMARMVKVVILQLMGNFSLFRFCCMLSFRDLVKRRLFLLTSKESRPETLNPIFQPEVELPEW